MKARYFDFCRFLPKPFLAVCLNAIQRYSFLLLSISLSALKSIERNSQIALHVFKISINDWVILLVLFHSLVAQLNTIAFDGVFCLASLFACCYRSSYLYGVHCPFSWMHGASHPWETSLYPSGWRKIACVFCLRRMPSHSLKISDGIFFEWAFWLDYLFCGQTVHC